MIDIFIEEPGLACILLGEYEVRCRFTLYTPEGYGTFNSHSEMDECTWEANVLGHWIEVDEGAVADVLTGAETIEKLKLEILEAQREDLGV
jgi:hypothetical protein